MVVYTTISLFFVTENSKLSFGVSQWGLFFFFLIYSEIEKTKTVDLCDFDRKYTVGSFKELLKVSRGKNSVFTGAVTEIEYGLFRPFAYVA